MENTDIDSYVVCSPGGHYHDYAKLNGLIKSHQHAVIRFSKFNKWYNEARFASSNLKVAAILPPPTFVGDTYAIAQDMANELNKQPTTAGATI
jgi:hypothetical protein